MRPKVWPIIVPLLSTVHLSKGAQPVSALFAPLVPRTQFELEFSLANQVCNALLEVVNADNLEFGSTNYMESAFFYPWQIKVPKISGSGSRYPIYPEDAWLYEIVVDIDNDGDLERLLSVGTGRLNQSRYLVVFPADYIDHQFLRPGELPPMDDAFTGEFVNLVREEIENGYRLSIEEPQLIRKRREETKDESYRFDGLSADYFVGHYENHNYIALERSIFWPDEERARVLNRFFLLDISPDGGYKEICILKRINTQGE